MGVSGMNPREMRNWRPLSGFLMEEQQEEQEETKKRHVITSLLVPLSFYLLTLSLMFNPANSKSCHSGLKVKMRVESLCCRIYLLPPANWRQYSNICNYTFLGNCHLQPSTGVIKTIIIKMKRSDLWI